MNRQESWDEAVGHYRAGVKGRYWLNTVAAARGACSCTSGKPHEGWSSSLRHPGFPTGA